MYFCLPIFIVPFILGTTHYLLTLNLFNFMKKERLILLKEVLKNSFISMVIFAIVLLFLCIIGLKDNIQGIAIASGVIGSAYVLTIRNPNNYFGFVLGIVASALLGIQFYYLANSIDLFFLYFFIFIPSQAIAIYTWSKGNKQKESSVAFNPSFLSLRNFLIVSVCFVVLFVADIFIIGKVLKIQQSSSIQIFSALVVASSILANILLIKKKTDSWYYWFIFSITGIVLNILYNDYVTVTLFIVYLLINSEAGWIWIKKTPKEKYGWLLGK